MSSATRCPVCGTDAPAESVVRDRLPAMQNYVYRSFEAASTAPEGRLSLASCRTCGFAWNAAFDPQNLVYDEGYDNAVPSGVMTSYYAEIVARLAALDLGDGLVVDVGCGDGAFLRALCQAVPTCRGLGVDPALERDRSELDGRITLVKDLFSPELLDEAPALMLSRHVLEHIPDPVAFLRAVKDAAHGTDCPCFFEVPDLEWIVRNGAFWDFCYEHCNYFTAASFGAALERAGLSTVGIRNEFGGQYLWINASTAEPTGTMPTGSDLPRRLAEYAATEREQIVAARERLRAAHDEGRRVVVWGMATKGILFTLLVDDGDTSLVDYCVDVNTNKQGCFVPLSSHRIDAPDALRDVGGEQLFVLAMNENYRAEIEDSCAALGLSTTVAGLTG